jgi:hypothetical protein
MADVITSIGSDSSITTGTPSSCSGSSSPYTVAFPSAPSGVSIGDSVSLTDEITTYATFTYLVTDISGSSLTLKFLTESSGYTGDTSPCDIQKYDESFNPVQSPGTFKRTYSTITAWELDLDNTVIYSSGDDAIGECYKDSNFNEAFTINGGGTVGLDSVKLTAPAGQRHDGTAGSGVVNVYNSATQSTSVISRQNCTISFMEYHMGNNSVNNRACTVTTSAYTDIIFSQNIIHNLTGSFPIAIFFDDGNSSSDTRYCHNNLFYDIDDNDDRVKAVLVSGSYPLKCWNNTTYLIRTGSGSKNAYSFACDTSSSALEIKNCLAIMTSSVGTDGFALNYNSDSDYNGSDFSTATGNSNDLTSLTTAVFEDYDASPPEFALASGASPIDAGVDLGTTGGVNIDITGRDRSSDSDWSMGAFQFVDPNVTVSADPLIGVGVLGTPAVSKSTTISASALTAVGVLIGTSAESITISAAAITSVGTLLGTSSKATTISASPMISIGLLSGSSAEAITITASPLTSVAVLGGSTTETITISASPMISVSNLSGSTSEAITISSSPMISIGVLTGSPSEAITISADSMVSVGTMTGSRIGNVTVTASPMVSESKLLGTAVERITIASSPLTSVATLEGALIGDVTVNASPMISNSLLLGNRVTGYEVLYITDARLNRSATNCSISVSKITDVILKE